MVGWGPTHLPLLTCALFLLLWRSDGLVGRGRHWGPKEDQTHTIGKGMQLGHDETMKRHLDTMHTLSRQYWQYLACGLWQASCKGEENEQADMDQEGKELLHICLPALASVIMDVDIPLYAPARSQCSSV